MKKTKKSKRIQRRRETPQRIRIQKKPRQLDAGEVLEIAGDEVALYLI